MKNSIKDLIKRPIKNQVKFFAAPAIFLWLFFSAPAQADAPRVISLYPGHTDNVAALGGTDMIVAASYNDDLEALAGLPRLPSRAAPEAILAHSPDVVLMRSLNARASPETVSALERAGVKVHVMEPPSWDEFDGYLRRLGDILGLDPAEALSAVSRIKREAADRASAFEKNSRPRVFLEATGREIHTCAPDSWAARVIELCGGENAAGLAAPLRPDSPLAAWGVERAVLLSPSLDVYLVQQGAMNVSTEADVQARPWFEAFGGAKLAFVPERFLSRPSLAGLERGVEALLAVFYPDGGSD